MNPYLNKNLNSNFPFVEQVQLPFSRSLFQGARFTCACGQQTVRIFLSSLSVRDEKLSFVLSYSYGDVTGVLAAFTNVGQNEFCKIFFKSPSISFVCSGFVVAGQLCDTPVWTGQLDIQPQLILSVRNTDDFNAIGYTQYLLDGKQHQLRDKFCINCINFLTAEFSSQTEAKLINTIQAPGYSLSSLPLKNDAAIVTSINGELMTQQPSSLKIIAGDHVSCGLTTTADAAAQTSNSPVLYCKVNSKAGFRGC